MVEKQGAKPLDVAQVGPGRSLAKCIKKGKNVLRTFPLAMLQSGSNSYRFRCNAILEFLKILMAFKTTKGGNISLESPEAMFRDMRARKVEGLLSHQADLLREYTMKTLNAPDVAFQLPTGSGKTLVGLLIGEWRRRRFQERVVYLCPTNQLVYQVGEQARSQYGLKVNVFTGKKSDFDPVAKSEYLNGETIAITSYSSLFNVNPFFGDPQVIIMDDAHSAESYIVNMWSVRIERHRSEHSELYSDVVKVLMDVLPLTDFQKLQGEWNNNWDASWVDKIPTPVFQGLIPSLISILDTHIDGLDIRFPWSQIRDKMDACHFYVGPRELLLRPLLPPTNTHQPFVDARQRIYMSATLGEGGELERLTGRSRILRLQIPQGWDKQGIGRRMFFFPDRSLESDQVSVLLLDMIKELGRALFIVPDDQTANGVRGWINENLGYDVFSAKEIELSKLPFISNDHAVAVIANRYDGIDFPAEECRLLMVEGLPRATNLQERFFITRMGAVALLNDRILTRVIQAFGRCTRAATDYAAIVIVGEELNTYLQKRERREFLHPELQAELQFGLLQSKDIDSAEFTENLRLFIAQGDEWADAESSIVALRQSLSQKKLPGTSNLRGAVEFEIEYQYAIWRGNYVAALQCCRKVLTELTDPELKGYRALWYYLAGSAAWLAQKDGAANLDTVSRDYFSEAMAAAHGVRWLISLSRMEPSLPTDSAQEPGLLTVIERLETELEKLGTVHDRNYSKEEQYILENLMKRDHKLFESAHERLGRLLGFESGNEDTSGAPDPWWIVDEKLCFIFEDHSNAENTSSMGIKKARQVSTHPDWALEKLPLAKEATVLPILVTPVLKADKDALTYLKRVYLWRIDDFREWAKNALAVVRDLRKTFPGSGDLGWRAVAIQKYRENKIDPTGLTELVKSHIASDSLKP